MYDATVPEIRAYLKRHTRQYGRAVEHAFRRQRLQVGGYASNTALAPNGRLDEFRFYSRALTAGEIAPPTVTPGVCQ